VPSGADGDVQRLLDLDALVVHARVVVQPGFVVNQAESETIQDYMLAKRRKNGWSVKEAAELVGVDPGTWRNWERGQLILYRKHRELMARLLGLTIGALDQEMAARWNRSHRR
jgi:ribosome-binding protein aMBF1 (putative translation factor)